MKAFTPATPANEAQTEPNPGAVSHISQSEHLRNERDRFLAFAFASADILVEMNDDGIIDFIDGATFSLTGKRPEAFIGKNFLDMIAEDERQHMKNLIEESKSLRRFDHLKLHLLGETDSRYATAISGFRLPFLENKLFITLSIMRKEIEATEIGKRDLRTGLYRQTAFSEKTAALLGDALANGDQLKVSLFEIPELFHPPAYVDAKAAEQLLGNICDYFQSVSYDGDSAGNLSNGTFMVLHEAELKSESITRKIKSLFHEWLGAEEALTLNSHELLADTTNLSDKDCARAILYTINKFAQRQGDTFTLSSLSEGYQGMLDETVDRIAAFNQTIAQQSFEIALQPIVDLRTEQTHHFEVLTRLKDQDAFSNPFDFITFGEDAGIIGDFDLAMCQATFDLLHQAAKRQKRPSVSVNLSGHSISSDLFRDTLLEMLNRNDDIRKQVIFEVTESARIPDLPSANNFLQELRNKGNLCCLDDFGAGECSFDYVRHLEVDYIKIDGSYVRDSLKTPRGQHLLRAMIALCQDLQIHTIGEMVEDEKVAKYLASCGVTMGQGYYFGKPSTEVNTVIDQVRNAPVASPNLQGTRVPAVKKVPKSWASRG